MDEHSRTSGPETILIDATTREGMSGSPVAAKRIDSTRSLTFILTAFAAMWRSVSFGASELFTIYSPRPSATIATISEAIKVQIIEKHGSDGFTRSAHLGHIAVNSQLTIAARGKHLCCQLLFKGVETPQRKTKIAFWQSTSAEEKRQS
jgi:hypothetical protein